MARILIVDDDATFRALLKAALGNAGHAVEALGSGVQALRMTDLAVYDVVITDILMPDKDGLELVRELRRSHPGMKIIAISGGGSTVRIDYLPAASAMGADAALKKPFALKDLIALVEKLVGAADAA